MPFNFLHPIIQKRRSPKAYIEKMISPFDLDLIFEAGRWAASSSNEQPWRFIYAFRGEIMFNKMMENLNPTNSVWAQNASVVVLAVAEKYFRKFQVENKHARHDLGAAIAQISLQAASMDIYAHPMAGFNREKMAELFKIDHRFDVVTVFTLGYLLTQGEMSPEQLIKETAERKRKPKAEIVFHGKFIAGDAFDPES